MNRLSHKLLLLFLLVACSPGLVSGQSDAKPSYAVGDSWQFQATTMPGDKRTDWSRKIVEISPEGMIRLQTESGYVFENDLALNVVFKHQLNNTRVLMKYPIKVGDQWTFVAERNDRGAEEKGAGKVALRETVTVPAGTFDCYRLEAESDFSDKLYRERRVWIRWYCPEVKWIAKERFEKHVYNPATGGETATLENSELVKFSRGD